MDLRENLKKQPTPMTWCGACTKTVLDVNNTIQDNDYDDKVLLYCTKHTWPFVPTAKHDLNNNPNMYAVLFCLQ